MLSDIFYRAQQSRFLMDVTIPYHCSSPLQVRSRLPHLKAIVQYSKRLSDKEEGISILEVRERERERERERMAIECALMYFFRVNL